MKTMMQSKLKRLAALFLVAVMSLGLAVPYMAAPEDDTIYIRTAEDLVELSKNCGYDKWSVGKTIILSNDISLKDVEFEPIPYFAGTFDGQGNTISDFELDGSYYPAGLFGTTKQGALVYNLIVTGSVIPTGNSSNVGSIVGENNGIIKNCHFSGVVSGENSVGGIIGINKEAGTVLGCSIKGSVFGEFATGGIVGTNYGTISNCINEGYINNTSKETALSLEDIGTNLLLDLYAINSSDITSGATDTGGIAGYSTGIVHGCSNRETIGYSRVGYNVGGIIGRNSGYVFDCSNYGDVLGRKDVGGIIGQAEPYIIEDITSSKLAILEGQFSVLEEQIDSVSAKVENTGDDARNSMKAISSYMSQLRTSMEELNALLDAENQKLSSDLETLEDTMESIDATMDSIEVAMGEIEELMNSIEETLELLEDSLEELEKELDELDTTLESMEERTSSEIKALKENINSLETLVGELRELAESMEEMDSREEIIDALEDSSEILGDILEILEEMLASLESYLEFMDVSLEKVSQHRADIAVSVREITGYLKEIKGYAEEINEFTKEIYGYLKDIKGYIESLDAKGKVDNLQEFQDSATSIIEEITSYMEDVADELENMDKNLSESSEEIDKDIEEIVDQISVIMNTIEGVLDESEDASESQIITETTVTDIISTTYGKVADSINYAAIEGDINVGGIAGNMSVEYENDPEEEISTDISWRERKAYELKTVLYDCTNKGKVIAKKDTVGAICGQMDIGIISTCYGYGRVTSEGGNYVGGIVGIARATITDCIANCGLSGENYVGGIVGSGYETQDGGSSVENCYTLVKITDCKQFEGAIGGCKEGSFKNNYFVSNTLQGINRVSYEGEAQPISYEELLQIPNIPDELKGFTLTFVAEDKVIKSIDFNYGDSFGEDVFPQVPGKDGYDGVWDITDLTNLCFDTEVTAEYILYVTSLKSDAVRENGRPVFLVKGDFSNEDVLIATSEEVTEELLEALGIKVNAEEYWKVSFSDDGQKRHSLRFLPDDSLENAKIYIKEDGKWKEVETEEFGSYKTFQVIGNEVELVVVPIRYELIGLAILLVLGIALVAGIILLEIKKQVFSGLFKSVLNKFGIKRLMIFFIVLGVIGAVISIVYLANLPQVRISAELAAISADAISAKNQSMKLDMTADVGSNHIELDSKIYVLNEDDASVFVLEENEHAIYLANGAVFLENGKAYSFGETEGEDNSLLEQIQKLYRATEIIKTEEQDKVIYSITATGEDAEDLMAVLVPSTEGQIATAGDVIVRIVASDGILQWLELHGSASLKNAMETEIIVSAIISEFSELEDGEYALPSTVEKAIAATEVDSLATMGEEIYRLLLAWTEFNGDEKDGTVKLDVSCGPINLETEHDWADISKGISDASNASNIEKLPDLVYEVCMNGEFTSKKLGNSYIFQIELDEAAMKELAGTIAPEIQTQTISLTEGMMEVVIENNEIVSFEISMGGNVNVLLSEVDASVEAEFTFE